jgi:hypothetical protein
MSLPVVRDAGGAAAFTHREGDTTSVLVRVESLDPPERVYDADFAWVRPRLGGVSLFFGKQHLDVPDVLRSRVELKLSPDRFLVFWRMNQNGDFQKNLHRTLETWPVALERDAVNPSRLKLDGDKDHSEWVTLSYVVRSGGQASMDFYYIPPREVVKARDAVGRTELKVLPVLRVNLSIGELGRLLDDCSALAPEVEASLPESERPK